MCKPNLDETMTKRCSKCLKVKPLEAFHVGSRYRDGSRNECKQCCSEYGRKYRSGKVERRVYRRRNAEVVRSDGRHRTCQYEFCRQKGKPLPQGYYFYHPECHRIVCEHNGGMD